MEDCTKRLIEIVNQEPQLRRALDIISEFKWVRINEMSKQQLNMLAEEGFRFHRETLGSRREDVKQYLKEHPECRQPDTNSIIDAIGYRLLLLDDDDSTPTPTNFEAELRHQERMEEKRRRAEQKKSKKVEEDEDDSPNLTFESSDEETQKKKSKKQSKKLHK